MVDIITHLSKAIECTITRVNQNLNYRLWVLMMCQYGFISCSKYRSLVDSVGNGKGVPM